MFCKNCGFKITDHSNYCSSCGSKIEWENNTSEKILDEKTHPENEKELKYGFSTNEYCNDINKSSGLSSNDIEKDNSHKFFNYLKAMIIKIWKKMNWVERVGLFISIFFISRIYTTVMLGKTGGTVSGVFALLLVFIAVLVKRKIIKTEKTWISIVSLVLSAIMMIPFSISMVQESGFKEYSNVEGAFNNSIYDSTVSEMYTEESTELIVEETTVLSEENITLVEDYVDYSDASSFESALNSGKKVKGKTVKFELIAYKPESALGINCWAGEHLNFISSKELDVESGDIIVALVTGEARNTLFSTDRWIIDFEVIEIIKNPNKQNSLETETTVKVVETNTTTTEIDTKPNVTKPITTTPSTTSEPAVFYSTNTRKTVGNGNSGVYAYKDDGKFYDVYYIIDFDEGYVYYFLEGDGNEFCDKLKIESGNLNSVLIITYHDGSSEWSYGLHFKYKNQPSQLIVQDEDGFELDYSPTDLDTALAYKRNKTITNY